MRLFVVRHTHEPARCPASDPSQAARLLSHLSRPNARRHGVEIKAEGVVDGAHAMFLIAEAEDEDALHAFLEPFAMAGTIEVMPASTCEQVVASGCGPGERPVGDGFVDPQEACQTAIDAGLLVHSANPLNGETSIEALVGGVVMPNAHFYVRNHFPIPRVDASTWRLRVSGRVERPLELTLKELHAMRSETLVVTLECAGNGRSMMRPSPAGEPWELGAVSTAEWTGVPLCEVLDRAGVESDGVEVVFRGADSGRVDGIDGEVTYERSLTTADARDPSVILAYAMNGEALPIQHGYPLRIIVPGWFAMTSVKWLTEIEVVPAPFSGKYQTQSYVYEWQRDGRVVREPVTLQRVRSLVVEPHAGDAIDAGAVTIRGVAWSGAAPIARVEVQVGEGDWQSARLVGERRRHGWQWWELAATISPGATTIRSKATDLAGRTQPQVAEWNPGGYGNNAIVAVPIRVG